MGEHLVLYGHAAIAMPLRQKKFILTATNHDTDTIENIPKPVQQTLLADIQWLRKNYQTVYNKYSINITSAIPPGYGGGVSAAWSVALVRLLLSNKNEQLSAITELENQHHGTASGIDHATIFFDGVIHQYRNQIQKFSLETFFSAPLLGQTYGLVSKQAPQESTKDMIKIFAQSYKSLPAQTLPNVADLQNILQAHDASSYADYLNIFGETLEQHFVAPDYFVNVAKKFRSDGGAIKICGAGARTGGFGLALAFHSDKKKIQILAKDLEAEFFSLG
jgi:mevalonate kinase